MTETTEEKKTNKISPLAVTIIAIFLIAVFSTLWGVMAPYFENEYFILGLKECGRNLIRFNGCG